MASPSIRRRTMRRSWSDLPTDLLLIMINNLKDIFDFVHFGAVCRRWRTTLWLYRKNIPPQQLPLLLVASKHNSPDRYFKFCLINFSNGVHTKVLSEYEYDIEDCYYAGHGWLLAVDSNGRHPFLVNPFLSINNSIELPDQLGFDSIRKVVLSDSPARTSSYVVMVMGFRGNLKFFTSGNKCWTHIQPLVRDFTFVDGIYYKGTACFYFVTSSGRISCVELRSNQPREKKSQFPNTVDGAEWLVESSSGELFAVARKRNAEKSFFVYELVGSDWIELQTLGGHILFLGANSFMYSYSDCSAFKPNHIYYGEYDMKEFTMEDRSNHPLLGDKFSTNMVTKPIWVQPTLNMSNFALADTEHQ